MAMNTRGADYCSTKVLFVLGCYLYLAKEKLKTLICKIVIQNRFVKFVPILKKIIFRNYTQEKN